MHLTGRDSTTNGLDSVSSQTAITRRVSSSEGNSNFFDDIHNHIAVISTVVIVSGDNLYKLLAFYQILYHINIMRCIYVNLNE